MLHVFDTETENARSILVYFNDYQILNISENTENIVLAYFGNKTTLSETYHFKHMKV